MDHDIVNEDTLVCDIGLSSQEIRIYYAICHFIEMDEYATDGIVTTDNVPMTRTSAADQDTYSGVGKIEGEIGQYLDLGVAVDDLMGVFSDL